MDIRNRRAIHQTAVQALSRAREPKKIVLVYTVGCCALALLSTIISIFLGEKIAGTGGLSNMGLRSMLSTGQTVLPIIQTIVVTCLGLGYHIAMLRIHRGEDAQPRTLLEGFHHFGPLLRTVLLQTVIYVGIAIGCLYLSTMIFMVTPFSNDFIAAMEPLMDTATVLNSQITLDDAALAAASEAISPVLWIYFALFVLLVIPVYYRYRMSMFCLAENPRQGAFAALRKSRFLLHHNRFALFRLDLSMWWYYLLQVLITVVCYGDMLLPLLGVTLPWSQTVSYYVFYCISLALQIAGYYFLMNRVYVTYAVAYDALQEPYRPDNQNQITPA